MKELRYFYDPEASLSEGAPGRLEGDEASHAVRVLRLGKGDDLNIIDGRGHLIQATVTATTKHDCDYIINKVETHPPLWPCPVIIGVAPTKNIDRLEWFVEKATEIGVDRIVLLNCQYSERRVVNTDRLDRIAVAAMKQSHKFYKPVISNITDFGEYIQSEELASPQSLKFIAHCYDDADLTVPCNPPLEDKENPLQSKPFLLDVLSSSLTPLREDSGSLLSRRPGEDIVSLQVLIGPEGDFSTSEVRQAISRGYLPVSLGESRLRTETAALVAVHLMQLAQR